MSRLGLAGLVLGWACATSGDCRAAESVGEGPVHKGKTLKVWVKALEDKDRDVRKQAVEALGHLSASAKPAVPALCTMLLRDSDPGLRTRAALVLYRIGPHAKRAVPALIGA